MVKKLPPSAPDCICIRQLAHLLGITYGHAYSFVTSGILPQPHSLPQVGYLGWKKQHLLDHFSIHPNALETVILRAAKRSKAPKSKDEFLAPLRDGTTQTTAEALKSAEAEVLKLECEIAEREKLKLAKVQAKIAELKSRLSRFDDAA